MHATTRPPTTQATMPTARGPLSERLIDALTHGTPIGTVREVADADPYGDDLQLALYTAYELHYAGFVGVDDDREWDPDILAFRRELERTFVAAVRDDVDALGEPGSAAHEMAELSTEPVDGDGASFHLRDNGTWDQFVDYFRMRSLYHLKEADPHAWAIPRLRRTSKAAFVAVEFDEFGGGRAERMHSVLYSDLLAAAGLDTGYLAYLDRVPAETLATVNFMSLCGLHRAHTPKLVGLFASAEITSSPMARRMARGLERLGAPDACIHFYTEHIEADAVHEQVLRYDVAGDLVERDPRCAGDVAFGAEAMEYLEGRLAAYLLERWKNDESSLLGTGSV